MAWTEITRPKYQRDGLRYASDTTDEEWALIEPHLPAAGFLRADARGQHARGGQCGFLHRPDRLPVAPAAEEFPALHIGGCEFRSIVITDSV